MRIDILTLFPDFINNLSSLSIVKRAQKKGLVNIFTHNLRDYATDKHRTVDDRPYGGGPGMIMMVEPIYKAVINIKKEIGKNAGIYLMTPQGKIFNQHLAEKISRKKNIIIICGHYEGIDERVINLTKAKEISIGDYILSGGEVPSMVVVDSIVRLIPGVLGSKESLMIESFTKKRRFLLDHPQYTKPPSFLNSSVPEVLLSGNHQLIEKWRDKKAMEKTRHNRPDLIERKK